MESWSINDSTGNGNGKLDPGETADFFITMKNTGTTVATNVLGLLSSGNEYVTINNPSVSYGDLKPDSSRVETYSVTADPDTPDATTAVFNFNWVADNNISGADSFDIIIGQKPVVIIDLAGTTISPDSMVQCLDILSTPSDVVSAIPDNLNEYKCAFVCLGIYSDNYVLNDADGTKLADFLNNGGRIYMEGGDTWAYDSPTPVHPMFHIIGLDDGSDNLSVVAGDENNFMNNYSFVYNGANNYIDEIDPDDSARLLMINTSPLQNTAVSFFNNTYKTVGATFEFGGLTDNETCNKAGFMAEILSFFDVSYIWTGTKENKEMNPSLTLYPNPAATRLSVSFYSVDAGDSYLVIYDMAGRVVIQQSINIRTGQNKINLNVSNLKNGIYSVELTTRDNIQTGKLVITK